MARTSPAPCARTGKKRTVLLNRAKWHPEFSRKSRWLPLLRSIAAIQKENVKRLKGLLYKRLENGSLKGLFRKLDVDGSVGLDKREWNRGIQKMGFHLLQGASLRGGTV